MKVLRISLSHGSGGAESSALLNSLFKEILGEFMLDFGEDSGVIIPKANMAISTDSYVVSPIFFNGGDIGKLSICGSANDVSMRGAKPMYITLGLIIEEGFELTNLKQILQSIKKELESSGIKIISGDTKVVPKGAADGIYINTTAIGELQTSQNISAKNIQDGDVIILSAPIGTHGSVIFCHRNEIALQSELKSDCALLYPMLDSLFAKNIKLNAMRDATRGGLAAVLHEWSFESSVEITLDLESIPILEQVRGVCEILGLDSLSLANEGVCIIAAPKENAESILQILHSHPLGSQAAIIGSVSKIENAKSKSTSSVYAKNAFGVKLHIPYPQGELLPRIC